jgi:Ras-related protein Rab-6A
VTGKESEHNESTDIVMASRTLISTPSSRSVVNNQPGEGDVPKFKVVLLGDESSGKTSVIRRAVEDKFSKEYEATLGVDLFTKTISVPDKGDIRLQVWDTSGQERFKTSIPSYIRGCHVAIITFQVTSRKQFDSIEKWVNEVSELREQDEVWIYIVATSCDRDLGERCFTREEMTTKLKTLQQNEAPKNNILQYLETSAKAGCNIRRMLYSMTTKLIDQTS